MKVYIVPVKNILVNDYSNVGRNVVLYVEGDRWEGAIVDWKFLYNSFIYRREPGPTTKKYEKYRWGSDGCKEFWEATRQYILKNGL